MPNQDEQTRALARLLAIGLCVGAAVFAVVILGEDRRTFDLKTARMVATVFFGVLLALAAAPGVRLAQRHDSEGLATLGVLTTIVALLALGGVVATIWTTEIFGNGEGTKVALMAALTAMAMGFTSVLMGSAREGDGDLLRAVRASTVVVLFLLVVLTVVEVLSPGPDIGQRWFGLLATAFVLGSALTPLLRAIEEPAAGEVPRG